MSIGVSGLGSGLDTESIISQMMSLERRPVLLLQSREAGFQSKISALGGLKSELASLQSTMAALKDPEGFIAFTGISGNASVLSVSASDEALAGSYQVQVDSLATAQQMRGAAFTGSDDVVGTGTLTIQVGTGTAFDVEIDADHESLAGIATAINEADTDVSAAVVDDGNGNFYLTLSSSETGAANTISMTMADDDGINTDAAGLSSLYTDPATETLTETQAAANAQLSLNGVAVERSENTITDLVAGVTMTLKDTDPGNPFSLTVSQNTKAITSKVEALVEQYNSLVDVFDSVQKYDEETGTSGPLQGDSTLRHLRSNLQDLLYAGVDGVSSGINSLSALGVEVDQDGKLSLNSATLTTAVEENGDDLITFFTNDEDGNEGIALRFDNLLEGYLSSTGLLKNKEDGFQASIDDIGDQIERIDYRLALREENLRNQFLALESLMAQFQATSGALDQQLQSLANLSDYISNK